MTVSSETVVMPPVRKRALVCVMRSLGVSGVKRRRRMGELYPVVRLHAFTQKGLQPHFVLRTRAKSIRVVFKS